MGLSEREFWECTPHYFVLKLNGLREITRGKIEAETRRSWEQTRFLAWAAGHWKEGTRLDDIIRFDWEQLKEGDLLKKYLDLKDKWLWNVPNWDKINIQYFD
jgi:hypothetical protein